MNIPMRQKYVDEAVGIFHVFGVYFDKTVDVNDGNRDVFEGLPVEIANRVVDAQAAYRQELYSILCDFGAV